MRRRSAAMFAAVVVAAVIGSIVVLRGRSTPMPNQPTPTAAPQVNVSPVPAQQLAPVVIQHLPELGEQLRPDGAVMLVFDRAMDQASVAAALQLTPAVAGRLSWPDVRTVVFTPNQALPHAAQFTVALGQGAKAQDGLALAEALKFRFQTTGYLEAGQVIPADGTQDVATTSAITVLFNRPVVPLTSVEQMANLPQPLSFEPAISGRGAWLNTAIYVFTADKPLASGTTYTGRIAPDLKDALGNPLQRAFSWQFTTARPLVVAIEPADAASGVSVEPTVRVQFNGPIDPTSVQGIILRDGAGQAVATRSQLLTDTLLLTPTTRLTFDTAYQIEVPAGSGAVAGGAGLAAAFNSAFRTAPLPKLVRTEPADGATQVNPWADFTLIFNAPIDPATVWPNLRVTPAISATEVYSYYDTTNNAFHLNLGQRPSTDFTVDIGPGIADSFGNTIDQTLTTRFRTAPLPASLAIVGPGVATYSSTRPARLALQATNTALANLALYRLPINVLEQPIYNLFNDLPSGAQELRRWTAQLNAPTDQPTLNRLDLLANGAALEAGIYMVQIENDPNQTQRHIMVVSPINLTLKSSLNDLLVWANDQQTGAPIANLAIDVYEEGEQMRKLGSLTTGSDGVGRLRLERADERGLIAIARTPFAAMGSGWAQTISRWEFPVSGEFYAPGAYAYAYTERPIYRPGQQVHFKGLVRTENDARFSALPGASVAVQIGTPTGERVYEQSLQLGPNGTFSGDLTLPAGAALGDYLLQMTLGDRVFGQTFRVAAYRPPEFAVKVAPSQPVAFRGEPIQATVATRYLFGAPLAGAQVTWNVLAEPYQFAPDWASRFQFGAGSLGRCWECWWQPAPPLEPILTGSGSSDAQGNLQIAIPASTLDAWAAQNGQSATLTLEAVATGRDNQAIAGRGQLVVHAAGVYVGLAPQTYVGRAGQSQQIEIVSASQNGTALANQSIAIEFQRVTWQNTLIRENGGERYESSEQITPAGSATVTTDSAGQATTSFTPSEGGAYRVIATARDSAGRTTQTMITTWVTGSDFVPWLRDSSDRITLVADKASYKPGETATILIPSPFQGLHWALITVERAGIKSYDVRRVESNSIVFQLPISAEDAPNLYVSAVLFAGASDGRTLADFKTGVLPITVEPIAQTLSVALTPSQPQAEPGAKLTYDLHVTDANGVGVAAELSLDLVDKGVLNLAPRREGDLAAALFAKRGLGVTTSSALTLSGDRTQEQLNQYAGGRGGGSPVLGEGMPAAAAPAATAAPANDAGKTDSRAQTTGPAIRENFADTAYWNPTVTTDSNGRGQIEVTLPDNLTTWTMRGVALTADTRAGEGIVDLVATKPLLVRPVTPRFFTVGDTTELAANITNNTDAPFEATIGLAATGLSVSSPLTQTLQIPARGEAQATWSASVLDTTSAELIFSATAGSYSDASKPRLATGPNGSLPVYRYTAPENVGTGGQLAQAGSRGEVIALPPNVDPQRGELTVRLDPSLAAGLRDGLRALEHYEYECAEQTVSRFLPNLLTARALKDLGVPNAELEATLPGLVADGVVRLVSKQNQDGGWGWWPGNTSNPQISAYAVFGLAKARDAGYPVPADALARGQDYLATQIKPTASANEQAALGTAEANQQAFLLFALAESGRAEATQTGELFAIRTKLATYARALLAMALRDTGAAADDSRIKALLADLNTSAITSATGTHWEEAERDWWSMNTDTRTSAIALEALVRLDRSSNLTPNIVRWLMAGRRDGAWASTQESAWSLMALTSYMARSGELQGNYDFAALLNGATQAAGRATPQTIDTPTVAQIKIADLLRDTGNVLTIGRGEGPGQLYYTAQLRSFLPVGEIKALDRGVIVQRRYTLASCTDGVACPEVRAVKLGDVLRVELSIIAPSDLHYLVVEDPLPAGVEAIDPALATSSVLNEGAAVGLQNGAPQSGFWRFPWWGWATRTELRDQKVALFADFLAKGAYSFSYTVRATQAGEYRAIPTTASELYFPEVYGRGDGAVLRIVGQVTN